MAVSRTTAERLFFKDQTHAFFRQLLTLVPDQQRAEATAQVENHVLMFEKIYEGVRQRNGALVAEREETQLQVVYAELKSSVHNDIPAPLPPPAHVANLDDVIQR